MPIFLFPKERQASRCVRVLQLTPIAQEEKPSLNGQAGTVQAPDTPIAPNPAYQVAEPESEKPSLSGERTAEIDPGSAPISAFLAATPFHTAETLENIRAPEESEKIQPAKNEASESEAKAQCDTLSRVHSSFSRVLNTAEGEPLLHIPISSIVPNPHQPRKHFNQDELNELARSIQEYGILQPLIVQAKEDSGHESTVYELIAGERRLHAARIAGLYTVPCILMHVSNEDSASIALIENLQRKNLDHFEQAQAIQALIQRYNYTQEQIANKLGCSQSYIANKLRILRLTPEEQSKIIKNKLTERHARALLQLQDQETRRMTLEQIIENQWTVAETERFIADMLGESGAKKPFLPKKIEPERRCFHSIERAVHKFRQNGGAVTCEKKEGSDTTEWIIRFHKK